LHIKDDCPRWFDNMFNSSDCTNFIKYVHRLNEANIQILKIEIILNLM
jgi:hypothetical protein